MGKECAGIGSEFVLPVVNLLIQFVLGASHDRRHLFASPDLLVQRSRILGQDFSDSCLSHLIYGIRISIENRGHHCPRFVRASRDSRQLVRRVEDD